MDFQAGRLTAPDRIVERVYDIATEGFWQLRRLYDEQRLKAHEQNKSYVQNLEAYTKDPSILHEEVSKLDLATQISIPISDRRSYVIWRRPAHASAPGKYNCGMKIDTKNGPGSPLDDKDAFTPAQALNFENVLLIAQARIEYLHSLHSDLLARSNKSYADLAKKIQEPLPAPKYGYLTSASRFSDAEWDNDAPTVFTGVVRVDDIPTKYGDLAIYSFTVRVRNTTFEDNTGTQRGYWNPNDRIMQLNCDFIRDKDPSDLLATIKHEVIHVLQFNLARDERPFGRPSNEWDEFKAPYVEKDIEFFPLLESIISDFFRSYRWGEPSRPQIDEALVRYPFFEQQRKKGLYEKAVREFTREVLARTQKTAGLPNLEQAIDLVIPKLHDGSISRHIASRQAGQWSDYVRGEWWLYTDGSSPLYADSDVGDASHVSIALEHFFAMYEDSLKAAVTEAGIELPEDADIFSLMNLPEKVLSSTFGHALWADLKNDPRIAYERDFNAIRAINTSFEAWQVTPKVLRVIQDFLLDQSQDSLPEGTVLVEESSTGKYSKLSTEEFLTLKSPGQLWRRVAVQTKQAGGGRKTRERKQSQTRQAGLPVIEQAIDILRNRIPGGKADRILNDLLTDNVIDDQDDLETVLEQAEKRYTASRRKEQAIQAGAKLEKSTDQFDVFLIPTYETSKMLGTKNWCIVRERKHFNNYDEKGIVFRFYVDKLEGPPAKYAVATRENGVSEVYNDFDEITLSSDVEVPEGTVHSLLYTKEQLEKGAIDIQNLNYQVLWTMFQKGLLSREQVTKRRISADIIDKNAESILMLKEGLEPSYTAIKQRLTSKIFAILQIDNTDENDPLDAKILPHLIQSTRGAISPALTNDLMAADNYLKQLEAAEIFSIAMPEALPIEAPQVKAFVQAFKSEANDTTDQFKTEALEFYQALMRGMLPSQAIEQDVTMDDQPGLYSALHSSRLLTTGLSIFFEPKVAADLAQINEVVYQLRLLQSIPKVPDLLSSCRETLKTLKELLEKLELTEFSKNGLVSAVQKELRKTNIGAFFNEPHMLARLDNYFTTGSGLTKEISEILQKLGESKLTQAAKLLAQVKEVDPFLSNRKGFPLIQASGLTQLELPRVLRNYKS